MSDPASDALTHAEIETELQKLCTSVDYLRAKSLARTRVAGVAGWTPEDLLQETVTKLLAGKRRWPRGLHPLVVFATAMDGIAGNTRKRIVNGPIDPNVEVDAPPPTDGEYTGRRVTAIATDNVEAAVVAANQLAEIEQLVADDEEAGLVVMAWAEGLRGKEAAAELGWTTHTYEAARKRLLRKLKTATR